MGNYEVTWYLGRKKKRKAWDRGHTIKLMLALQPKGGRAEKGGWREGRNSRSTLASLGHHCCEETHSKRSLSWLGDWAQGLR